MGGTHPSAAPYGAAISSGGGVKLAALDTPWLLSLAVTRQEE